MTNSFRPKRIRAECNSLFESAARKRIERIETNNFLCDLCVLLGQSAVVSVSAQRILTCISPSHSGVFGMTLSQAQERHRELVEEIRRHDHAYYSLAQPTITNSDYH